MSPFFLLERALKQCGIPYQVNVVLKVDGDKFKWNIILPEHNLYIRIYDKELKIDEKFRAYISKVNAEGFNIMITTPSMQPSIISKLDILLEASAALQGERWPFGTRDVLDKLLKKIKDQIQALNDCPIDYDNDYQ